MVIFLTIVVESELQAQWIESLHASSEPDGQGRESVIKTVAVLSRMR